MTIEERYLKVVRDALLNLHYLEHEPISVDADYSKAKNDEERGFFRKIGADLPAWAYTMCGDWRLQELEGCLRAVEAENVSGAYVECGVWRGGASVYAAAVIEAYGMDRQVYLCDSFEGLPKPRCIEDKGDVHYTKSVLAVDEDQVLEAFRKFDLLRGVWCVPGWFDESLPDISCDEIAVLRIDCDMYGSTMDVLTHLYPKVQPGGWVIVDDYIHLPGCQQAVKDYLADKGLDPVMAMETCASIRWKV